MSEYDDDGEDFEPITPRKMIRSKKKGNLGLGLLIGILGTILMELLIGITINTQQDLVMRYFAYMLGIFILLAVALVVKSGAKMFFVATPVIIILSFVFPYFLPDYFSGLMTPFLSLLPMINRVAESASSLDISIPDIDTYMSYVNSYGIVIDLIFALIIGIIASLGFSSLIKVFTKKFNILSIISLVFGATFFVIGVIILPYTLVVTTGVLQFTGSFATGGIALTEGMDVITAGGNISDANDYFVEASSWFVEAELMLQGLTQLQLFFLAEKALSQYIVIIENGILLVDSAVSLAKGISPALVGISKLQSGIAQAMSVLGGTGFGLSLSLTSDEITTFNNGLDTMEEGFLNISSSISDIQDSLVSISGVDEDAFSASLLENFNISLSNELAMIDGGAKLLSSSLDVFDVLITDPEGDDRAPFIHLLYGALALNEVSSSVGDSTSFEGTVSGFTNVRNNLSIVVDTFDDPAFAEFDTVDVGESTEILDFKAQIQGVFNFVRDAGDISISIADFGIVAGPALDIMNDSVSVFTQYDNFTVIPDSAYDEKIANLDIAIANGSQMMAAGVTTDQLVVQMQTNSTNGSYGMMSDAASEFVGIFSTFNLTENGANFFYLAGGFQSLMKTAKSLSGVRALVQNIQDDVVIIQTSVIVDNATITAKLNAIDGNMTESDATLNTSRLHIANAVGNFSAIGTSMPQMTATATSLTNISEDIREMQGREDNRGIFKIRNIANDPIGFFLDPFTKIDEVNTEISFIMLKFTDIQNELSNISVSS